MEKTSLLRTLRALEIVARAGPDDALVHEVSAFRCRCEGETGGLEGLATAVDAWLTQMVGPLLGRVDVVLEKGVDANALREVLRALWVLLARHQAGAHAELTELGALLSGALAGGDAEEVRRLVRAARAWFAEHQWEIAASLRRAVRRG